MISSQQQTHLTTIKHGLKNKLTTTVQCRKVPNLPPGWCMDDNFVPRYLGKDVIDDPENNMTTFEVRQYTHDGFQKCLANKTLVFIGESRVRYQLMNLASFLKTKKFMRCKDHMSYDYTQTEPDEECLVINEKTIADGGWTDRYMKSTQLLSDSHHFDVEHETSHAIPENQNSLCDCYRPAGGGFVPNHWFENRYIKRSTRYGEINLIFLQNFQNLISLNEDYPPFSPFYSNSSHRCPPGNCERWGKGNSINAFAGDMNATLYEILPLLNTTHAFMNRGWAGYTPDISCHIEKFAMDHPEIDVTYLTNPPGGGLDDRNLRCNIKYLDRTTPAQGAQEWYWDDLHALGILNEEYNHQLIKMLCPIEK